MAERFYVVSPEHHRSLCSLVDKLRDSVFEHIAMEWGWISRSAIKLVADTPGLRGLGVRLQREIEDGGAAPIHEDEVDKIADACGLYHHFVGPEEADLSDPWVRFEIAKCRLATGEGIWEYNEKAACHLLGPITKEEYDRQQEMWARQYRTRIMGVVHRCVQ